MSESDTYKFKKDPISGAIESKEISRMFLSSGNGVRVLFTPKGIRLIISKESLKNGDIQFFEDQKFLGYMD